MKKISLLIVCILFSCTTLAAGLLLPFLPQPQGESTAADSFQLQQRFLDFELDRMLKDRRPTEGYWTAGYETYLSFGLVQPAKGQSARVDEILRRSQWRQRHGLHGQPSLESLRSRLTVRYPRQGELSEEVNEALA